MRFQEYKQLYLKIIEQIFINHPSMNQLLKAEFEQLRNQILDHSYKIAVMGEFNNGKSTFINALLGEQIMPTGALPTTAILHYIRSGENEVSVVTLDDTGKEIVTKIKEDKLKDYIAKESSNLDEIQYIQISNNHPFLNQDVVLIDTPGLNDLSQMRAEITYGVLPHTDMIIVLLDLKQPLRQTEKEFLEYELLSRDQKKVLFIANFLDEVADEYEDSLDYIKGHLLNMEQFNEVEIFAISAMDAYEAKLTNDVELLELSGILEVEAYLHDITTTQSHFVHKTERDYAKLNQLLNEYKMDIYNHLELLAEDKDQLLKEREQIENYQQSISTTKSQIVEYAEERLAEMKALSNKSIQHLFNHIEQNAMEQIQLYNGNDIKNYFENNIVLMVKRSMKDWIEQYQPRLDELIIKYEEQITKAFIEYIKGNETIHGQFSMTLKEQQHVSLTAGKVGNTTLQAGLIAGGLSSLLLLVGAPILMPIIAFGGLGFLQKGLLEYQHGKLKPELVNILQNSLFDLQQEFRNNISEYLTKQVMYVNDQILTRYKRSLISSSKRYDERLSAHAVEIERLKAEKHGIIKKIEEVQAELKKGCEEISGY